MKTLFLSLIPSLFIMCAIVPRPKETLDELGCRVPPPSTFIKAGVSLSAAQAQFGGNKVEGGSFTITPEVIKLTSQAATDAELHQYLLCRTSKSYTNPKVSDYYTRFQQLLSGKELPSAAQILEWQDKNPPPSQGNDTNNSLEKLEKACLNGDEQTCLYCFGAYFHKNPKIAQSFNDLYMATAQVKKAKNKYAIVKSLPQIDSLQYSNDTLQCSQQVIEAQNRYDMVVKGFNSIKAGIGF